MNNFIKKGFVSLLSLSVLCPVSALTKTESVFSNLNTDGSINKTTVTNHICSKDKDEYIDNSSLDEIINLNGSETFTKEGDTLKWKSDGKDIYYQGSTSKEGPIKISINYYLDGEKKTAKEMVGKKGNVKIEINLENRLKNNVNINGNIEEVYTPFVVMAGTILDTNNNSNINITNGKVVETGSKAIVGSIASPGLYESLSIDKLSSLNKIEITYDTNKFSLNNIYIVATPKLIEEKDLGAFKDIDTLVNSINLLESNMDKIETGSKELNNGLKAAYDGSSLITKKVSESIDSLEDSDENVLDEETIEKIKNSAVAGATLSEEELNQIGNLAASKTSLSEEQLNYISSLALQEVGTITLTEEQKQSIISNVDYAVENIYGESIKSGARSQVDNLITGISSGLTITPEAIIALSNNQVTSDIASTISTNLNATISSNLSASKSQMYSLAESSAMASAKQIAENSALSSAESVANQTASTLTPAISRGTAIKVAPIVASESAKQTAATTSTMVAEKLSPVVAESVAKEVKKEATKQVRNNMITLNNGLLELNSGLEKLYNGSSELYTGITTFNNEGIKKLGSYTGIINTYASKAEALVSLSKEYKGFTTNNSNETIFINKVKSEK